LFIPRFKILFLKNVVFPDAQTAQSLIPDCDYQSWVDLRKPGGENLDEEQRTKEYDYGYHYI
jgi:hypothetical protein